VLQVLGPEDGKLFAAYYDVTESGNWDEPHGHAPPGPKNILHVLKLPAVFAKLHNLDLQEWNQKLAAMKSKMLEVRNRRVPPGLDDKILTAWNGLMIAPMARAARLFDEPKYRESAMRAADFVLKNLRRDGRLLRNHRRGVSELNAYLEDYAFLIEGLLNLYEATFDRRWLDEARELNETCIRHFFDEKGGGFFFTSDDHEELIVRAKNPSDGAIPSGNSVQAMNLVKLSIILDRNDLREKADSSFRAFAARIAKYPGGFDRLLAAADMRLSRSKEIALIGEPNATEMRAMLRTVFERYLPNKVVMGAPSGVADWPLLAAKQAIDGRPTAYVCENYACQKPVTSASELATLLER
jgi:hypothetical protein